MKGLERVHARQYLLECPAAARQMHLVHANACSTRLRTPQSVQAPNLATRPTSTLRPPSSVRFGLYDDFDAYLISRRTISSLQTPKRNPVVSSNSSTQSSIDASETTSSAAGSIDIDDIQAHKKAAVQQAFLNGTLGFGFSAGGLVFPYYGACTSQAPAYSHLLKIIGPGFTLLQLGIIGSQAVHSSSTLCR